MSDKTGMTPEEMVDSAVEELWKRACAGEASQDDAAGKMAEALKALPMSIPEYGRGPGMAAVEAIRAAGGIRAGYRPWIFPARLFPARSYEEIQPPVDWLSVEKLIRPPIVVMPKPPRTARNKRRARARWRAREVRRNAGVSALAATALPTPAPARGMLKAGTPESGDAFLKLEYSRPIEAIPKDWRDAFRTVPVDPPYVDDPDHALTPVGAEKLRPFPIRMIPQILDEPEKSADQAAEDRRSADAAAGLVPLPEKPKPPERAYVPNKWGEHD